MSRDGGSEADVLPFEAKEVTLPNDLRVIVVPTGFPNLVSLQIPVQTGSRNEVEPGKSGFAHFFEHMMFRGTKKYPADRYQEIVQRTGARQNAYTTDDYTNYHATFAAEDLETILELEADRFQGLEYSEGDFRTEARAVLGEYNKSAADPVNKLIEVQRDHAYQVHTYKHTTMGFIADIEAMPDQFDYSKLFFDRWYRPEYTSIIVAGDLEPESVIALVEKYWGSWKKGSHTVQVPQEPGPVGPLVAHVPWEAPTLPWVTLAWHGPAFSTVEPDYLALDLLFDLWFGETSDLHRRLVEEEQVVDEFEPYFPGHKDPHLASILARVKDPAKAGYVRDAILQTAAQAVAVAVDRQRLEDAKSNGRYGFARTLDNSESVASTLARYVRHDRSYDTLNALFRRQERITVDDLSAAASTYLVDARMVQTTLAHGDLPGLTLAPSLAPYLAGPPAGSSFPEVVLKSPATLVRFKLLFEAGSAHDPPGREGLAALSASMVAEAGSSRRKYDEIVRALFPIAGSLDAQVDREMTVFTGAVHRDNLDRLADLVLPQLLDPGMREEDFARLREQQSNALVQDLRSNNEEELGKERLQERIFRGTPYGHTTLGTVRGLEAASLDDVRGFMAANYTRANLTLGLAGDVPAAFHDRLVRELAALPPGQGRTAPEVGPHRPSGMEVEIIAKETRATAISLGHPIEVTRAHPDFTALWLARAWLGDHRASGGRLFGRIREIRGMNYGDYAYIEAFPRGMYQFFPDANLGRRAQLFEVWIRPVVPEQAVFALKLAVWEVRQLIERGLTEEEFSATRNYLAKNVFVMTQRQDQQLGYALDSRWYGLPEYSAWAREQLEGLTVGKVNDAVRRHLSGTDLSVVTITKDADALKAALLSPEPATIRYEAPKPDDILAEDVVVGALQLGLSAERIRITPVDEVFSGD
ncbi:MAG: pitrilysin family protein [Dehalococcoidia bacterium]